MIFTFNLRNTLLHLIHLWDVFTGVIDDHNHDHYHPHHHHHHHHHHQWSLDLLYNLKLNYRILLLFVGATLSKFTYLKSTSTSTSPIFDHYNHQRSSSQILIIFNNNNKYYNYLHLNIFSRFLLKIRTNIENLVRNTVSIVIPTCICLLLAISLCGEYVQLFNMMYHKIMDINDNGNTLC